MSNETIDLQKIFRETTETLLNPKEYFSSMPLEGGFAEPIIKAAIYGVVAGLFALLWSLLGFSPTGGGGIWGGAVGVMALIWSVVGAIATAFIGGALMAVISIICGGNRELEANVRVASSLMAVYPIRAFLAFTYGISFSLGGIVGLGISLYCVYLIYHAAVEALKGKEPSVKIAAIVLVAFTLIGFYGGRKANETLENYSNMFQEEQVD